MESKSEIIKFRVTESEKKFIQEKAKSLGFGSVTAFLKTSANDFFVIKLDSSHLRDVAKEISYIGKNINNLVHHIFKIGTYSDYDLKEIQRLQKVAIEKLHQEHDYFSKLRKKYSESNMTIKDKKRLIEELNKHEIEVPKEVLLEEIYEQIRNNVLYICNLIEDSPEQEEGISDYVYEYLFDRNLFDLKQSDLINFANEIYLFAEKMKMKMLNVLNVFEDEDWYDFKDILDKYENV